MPKIRKKSYYKKEIETWDHFKPATTIGQIVFAKLESPLWWPAVVVHGLNCGKDSAKPNYEWVFWYGDRRISHVSHQCICNFRKYFSRFHKKSGSKKYLVGIKEAVENCALQDGRVEELSDPDEMLKWASEGFKQLVSPDEQTEDFSLSEIVKDGIEAIKGVVKCKEQPTETELLIAEIVKDNNSAVHQTSKKNFPTRKSVEDNSVLQEPVKNHHAINSFLKKLDEHKADIENVCISCKTFGNVVTNHHPFFKGGICENCESILKKYMFALDEDGSMVACTICALNGELLLCDKAGCRRVYCITCIEEMGCVNAVREFKKQNPWYCMLCRDYNSKTDGSLVARKDWWENITKLFQKAISPKEINVSKIKKKEGMRVLSLFDGISTGYFALSQLGLHIDVYYAFETNENAINVSKMNFSDKIIHLGDVEKLTHDIIYALGPFDLVIGGSPCNDLSAVNPARKGLYDHQSTGRLFFEYFRVLKIVQLGTSAPLFWFYENVASMPVEYRNIITRFLNCEPNLIDAKHFSAQHRPRFYWGNIPGISSLSEVVTNDCPTLSSVITSNCMRTAVVDKLNTVTTQRNSLKPGNMHPVTMKGESSGIWITELEEVFGFPRHFTDVGNLSPQQRLSLLGQSWSVQVVINIFSSLRHFFETEK